MQNINLFRDAVTQMPEVLECYFITGEFDYLLKVAVRSRKELERFLTLVESLSGDDWQQPTDCTLWNVRDVLAHQAGAYASGASLAEIKAA